MKFWPWVRLSTLHQYPAPHASRSNLSRSCQEPLKFRDRRSLRRASLQSKSASHGRSFHSLQPQHQAPHIQASSSPGIGPAGFLQRIKVGYNFTRRVMASCMHSPHVPCGIRRVIFFCIRMRWVLMNVVSPQSLTDNQGPILLEWIPDFQLDGPLPSRSVPRGRSYSDVLFEPSTALIVAGSSLQAKFTSFDEDNNKVWEPDGERSHPCGEGFDGLTLPHSDSTQCVESVMRLFHYRTDTS